LDFYKAPTPSTQGIKMTNSIDHIVKNTIYMGPNFMYPESMKRQRIHWSNTMKTKIQKENLTIGVTMKEPSKQRARKE